MDDIRIELVPANKRSAFEGFFQDYLREHARFTGKKPSDGVYPYPWLDLYWSEPDTRWPFWAKRSGDLAALALVRFDETDARYELADFYVLPAFRKMGVGAYTARQIFSRFGGVWKLNQALQNTGATQFWRRVIGNIATYTEHPLHRDDGVERIEQRFTLSGAK